MCDESVPPLYGPTLAGVWKSEQEVRVSLLPPKNLLNGTGTNVLDDAGADGVALLEAGHGGWLLFHSPFPSGVGPVPP